MKKAVIPVSFDAEQLSAAKKLHDELESHYVGHMDFLKWRTVLDRILAELELA